MVSIYFYSLMGGDLMHTSGNYQGTEECTHRFTGTYCNSYIMAKPFGFCSFI